VSFATRLLSANPGAQVSSALSGSLTTPGAKGAFVPLNLGSYDALGTVTVGVGGLSSITFSGIPQNGYSHFILDYTNTSRNKTVRAIGGFDNNGTGAMYVYSGLATITSSIYSLTIADGGGTLFSEHSSFSLYGVK
jgi:hypothetical protein